MEIWDLYDRNRNIIGEHVRGEELPENGYHLVVHIWIKNSKGQYLIAQRAKDRRSNPLMWECQCGSVLKSETSQHGALREVKEEVGVDLDPDKGNVVFSHIRDYVSGKKFNDILDVWLFEYDGEVLLEKATTKEVAQVKWLYPEEIKKLYDNHQLVWTLQYFFEKIMKCKQV